MGKIICIANWKGGVGKTTTVVNLASALAARGKKILIVDVDPQGNSASGLNVETDDRATTYDCLIDETPAAEAIVETSCKNVWLLPADQELSGAQVELVGMIGRELRLRQTLEPVRENYDFIFIDTPPSQNLLTINALTASDSLIIPIQCEFYALEGISDFLQVVKMIRKTLNPALHIEGVCLTMYDSRTNLAREVVENIIAHFKEKTFSAIIPRNVRLAEAPSHGVPISQYAPSSPGAQAYEKLADEFLARQEGL